MSHVTSAGGWNRGNQLVLKASGAETASTTGPAVNTGDLGGSLYVKVAVTASAGTSPTLTVVVEGSHDGSNWFTLGTVGSDGYSVGTTDSAPANFTGAATTRAVFPSMQNVRYRSVIGGSAGQSFTYSVSAISG